MDFIVSIYGCMFLIGFLANGLLGLKFFCGPSSRTTNPFLYELLFADLLVCCLSGPSTVIILYTVAKLSPTWLQIFVFMQGWPVSASNLSMMALSISRYLTLKNFKTTEHEVKRRILLASAITVIWISAALLTSIHLINIEEFKKTFYLIDVILGYVLPICVVLSCYVILHLKLTTLSLRARASCGEVPLPIPMFRQRDNLIIISGMPQENRQLKTEDLIKVEEDISQMRRTTLRNRKRLANSLLFMAIAFAFCWLPYIICQFCEQLNVSLINHQYTLIMGQFHSAFNPIIYWSYNRKWPKINFKFQFPRHLTIHRSVSSTNEANLGPFHPKYIRPYHRNLSVNEALGPNCNIDMPCESQSVELLHSKRAAVKPRINRTRTTRLDRPRFVKSKSSEFFY